MPSDDSRSIRSWLLGEMNTILAVCPTPKWARLVTRGFRLVASCEQHGPRGMGLPWGQRGGWPKKVHIRSVTGGERMCCLPTGMISLRFSRCQQGLR